MKPHLISLFLLISLALHSYPISHATPLSDLIKSADENSPTLEKALAEQEEGEWKATEGFAPLLPTLTFNANHIFEKKYQYLNVPFGGGPVVEFPQIFPSSSGTLSARWTLFDGFSNLHLLCSAQKQRDSTRAHYHWTKFLINEEVTLAYYRWIAARLLKEVSDENEKTLEHHLSQAQQLKIAGVATSYDLLKIEAQLSEAKSETLLAADNIALSLDRLRTTIGVKTSIDPDSIPLPIPDANSIKNLEFPHQFQTRADLKALSDQASSAAQLDSAYQFFWMPKISLGADYIQYNNLSDPLTDWNRYRSAWNVGFSLNWTLFNLRDLAESRKLRSRALQAEKSLDQAMLQAPVDFSFWKKRYLYSASLYLAKKADLERAQETVRLAEAGFKAGIRTTTEVLDAELELFRARAGVVNSSLNCAEAKIKIELAIGEPL